MNGKDVIETINRRDKRNENLEKRGECPTPQAFLFFQDGRRDLEDVIEALTGSGKKIFDVNQYVTIGPKDDDICVQLPWYGKYNGVKIKDIPENDICKRKIALEEKLYGMEKNVDQGTVLLITYNDLYLKDEMFYNGTNNLLYEHIRSWLKDGYRFNDKMPLTALVLVEKLDRIRDFCFYGIPVIEDEEDSKR